MPHFTDSSKYDPPMDWLQTAIGFVPVATAVSLAVTLIVRWIDKPRAVFAFEMQLQSEGSRHDKEGLIFAAIALTNIGDGTAYDVELVGDGTSPSLYPQWDATRPAIPCDFRRLFPDKQFSSRRCPMRASSQELR